MAIKAEELQDIETMLADADASIFATLRQKYPHLAWSRCDASDVLEEPYRSFKAFDMHLFDVSNHCPVVVKRPGRRLGHDPGGAEPGQMNEHDSISTKAKGHISKSPTNRHSACPTRISPAENSRRSRRAAVAGPVAAVPWSRSSKRLSPPMSAGDTPLRFRAAPWAFISFSRPMKWGPATRWSRPPFPSANAPRRLRRSAPRRPSRISIIGPAACRRPRRKRRFSDKTRALARDQRQRPSRRLDRVAGVGDKAGVPLDRGLQRSRSAPL